MNKKQNDQWMLFMVGRGQGNKLKRLVKALKDSPNGELASKFMCAAKIDLKAASILNKKGVYSLAIFNLQQGIEKLCKSLFLYDNSRKIDYKALYKHNSLKIIEDWLFCNAKIQPNQDNPIEQILKNEGGILRNGSTAVRGILITSLVPLFKRLGVGSSISELFAYESKNGKSILSKNENDVKNEVSKFSEEKIKKLFIKLAEGEQETDKTAENFGSGYSKKQLIFIHSVIDLLCLAFVTFPHEQSSRYPPEKTGINPESYNRREIGIVKSFDFLLKMATDAEDSINEMVAQNSH